MKKLLLFCSLVLCFITTSSMQGDDGADITFDTMLHDFGNVRQGAAVKYEFKFKNSGNETLIITQGTSDCLYVMVDGTREPIAPGGRGVIKVTFKPTDTGNIKETLTVTSNAKGRHKSITLTVKGTVR